MKDNSFIERKSEAWKKIILRACWHVKHLFLTSTFLETIITMNILKTDGANSKHIEYGVKSIGSGGTIQIVTSIHINVYFLK